MDNFKGTAHINLQPGASKRPVFLRLKPCSGSTVNDGSMPNGSTIVSATVKAYRDQDGIDYSTHMVSNVSVSSHNVIAYLSYSTALPDGLYRLTATVTMSVTGLSTNYVDEFDCRRVYVRDL